MTSQEETLASLARLLEDAQIDYMIIGGLANAVWGEPRATLDIDVTVSADTVDASRIATLLETEFRVLVSDPPSFVEETRVLPLQSHTGVRVDLIFGLLPFEREAVARARSVEVAGREIRFCTPEDLILLKIISQREKDQADVQGILRHRFRELDLGYLEPRIGELSELLSRPEIWQNWSGWKAEIQENT